jgi:purine-binding chemotaxis protein CheW
VSAAARLDDDGEVLSFCLGGERFSLPSASVAEIIRPRAITRVPHAQASLLGVLNLRGRVLPVVSLAQLAGRAARPATSASRILVLDRAAPVGLWVDSVLGLARREGDEQIEIDALLARDFASLMSAPRAGREPVLLDHATRAKTENGVSADARPDLALIGFCLAGQEYALPLDEVAEVIALPMDVASLPHTDEAMLGVMALRGALLPLVSLRVLLGLRADGWDRAHARILVTRVGNARAGLVADSMSAILRVPARDVDQVPPVLTRGRGEAHIMAICRLEQGSRLVSILSADRLFDQATASRIQARATEETAQVATNAPAAAEKFVVFRLGGESYGLPIDAVDEVVRRPEHLTRVPRAPAFLQGVMNLRGQVVPVIDQRQRFAVNDAEHGTGRRVLIVTIDGLRAGFVVDAVSEVVNIPVTELRAAPSLAADGSQMFDRVAIFSGTGPGMNGGIDRARDEKMILLVDAKALLDRAERDVLAGLAAEAAAAS